jgi:hypothetical protein
MTAGATGTAQPPSYQPPPPGPGVQPPFVAPPTDGAKQRRWLAIGLGGAAALLCCVGGLFGGAALVVLGTQTIADQSRTAVVDYLSAVRDERYDDAYALLCDAEQATTPLDEFVRSFDGEPGITSFTVGEAVLANTVEVPATVRYDNGTSDLIRYLLEQDTSTAEFEVCGQAD